MSNGSLETAALVQAITEVTKQLQQMNKTLQMIHAALKNPAPPIPR
jgi:hypothetical protein